MTYTTLDIRNYKRVKHEALDRGITVKELVNRAIVEYLKKPHRKEEVLIRCRRKR